MSALLASSAIPGLFPPLIEGQHYVDGGLLDNTGIRLAIAAGMQCIYILSVTASNNTIPSLQNGISVLEQSFYILAAHHLRDALH